MACGGIAPLRFPQSRRPPIKGAKGSGTSAPFLVGQLRQVPDVPLCVVSLAMVAVVGVEGDNHADVVLLFVLIAHYAARLAVALHLAATTAHQCIIYVSVRIFDGRLSVGENILYDAVIYGYINTLVLALDIVVTN